MKKKFFIFMMAVGLVLFVSGNVFGSGGSSSSNTSPYRNRITIEYLQHANSNSMGMNEGFQKKLLNDKFNMDINYISTNLLGPESFITRSAAGNLGDIVSFGGVARMEAYQSGLIMDITNLLASRAPDLMKERVKIDLMNRKLGVTAGRTYFIPTDMSSYSPTEIMPTINGGGMLGLQEGPTSYVRWDAYRAVGMPTINTLEDLLPALRQMQNHVRVSDSGKPVYGMTIFNDWDHECMTMAMWFTQMYGYYLNRGSTTVFTHVGDTLKTQRLDDDNGLYLRALRFYYNANQMGLLDPDSAIQTWDDVWSKSVDGQVLFSGWAWAAVGPYNTPEHGNGNPPKGFQFVPIRDADYFALCYNPASQHDGIIALGSRARDPERLIDFINWTATPEGMQFHTLGPQGLAWDMRNGKPYLTEFGRRTVYEDNTSLAIPAEWGGGIWSNTIPLFGLGWNAPYLYWDINPATGYTYNPRMWPEELERGRQEIDRVWQRDMGAEHALDYLKKNPQMYSSMIGTDYIPPIDNIHIETARNTTRMIVRNASWRMVFAANMTEFNSIWNQMKADIRAAGWEDIVRVDLQNAADSVVARQQMIRSLR